MGVSGPGGRAMWMGSCPGDHVTDLDTGHYRYKGQLEKYDVCNCEHGQTVEELCSSSMIVYGKTMSDI